jgi:hypothetical protein
MEETVNGATAITGYRYNRLPVVSSSSTSQDAEGNGAAQGTIQPVMVNGAATLSCDTTQNG